MGDADMSQKNYRELSPEDIQIRLERDYK
jgi:hypothetical protein